MNNYREKYIHEHYNVIVCVHRERERERERERRPTIIHWCLLAETALKDKGDSFAQLLFTATGQNGEEKLNSSTSDQLLLS